MRLSHVKRDQIVNIHEPWYILNWTSGRWPFIMKEVHKKYGDVVLITPDPNTDLPLHMHSRATFQVPGLRTLLIRITFTEAA